MQQDSARSLWLKGFPGDSFPPISVNMIPHICHLVYALTKCRTTGNRRILSHFELILFYRSLRSPSLGPFPSPPTPMKCCIFNFSYASTLENVIQRHAQSNMEATVQVVELPYGYWQVVAMVLPVSPGPFGIGAQEGLCVCLCVLLRSGHPRRVAVCVLGTARWVSICKLASSVCRYL